MTVYVREYARQHYRSQCVWLMKALMLFNDEGAYEKEQSTHATFRTFKYVDAATVSANATEALLVVTITYDTR